MNIPHVTVDELEDLGTDGIVLIDVREAGEYAEARVPGAVLIPLATVPDRVGDIPAEGTVYLICAAGGRSLQAAEYLAAQGRDTVNVAGGTKAWVASGKPFDSGSVA